MNEKPDLALLHEYVRHRQDGAFAEIVQRYLNLVYSAALRIVADPHLAEDVSQAVFVALAQQADSVIQKLHQGAPLSGWLHLTTRNLAAKAVRTETRRRAREQTAAAMDRLSPEPGESTWDQIAPHLDEALAELPEPDRHALLLRYFEGHTARDVALRFGLSEEAAQKRVTRALDRLRHRFARRGLTISSASLSALIATQAVQAVPAALVTGITSVALAAGAAAAPAGLAVSFPSLVSALVMTKTQTAILLGFAICASVPVTVQHRTLSRLQAEIATPQPQLPASPRDPVEASSIPTESEAGEIDRLRHEIQALRARLAAKAESVSAPALAGRAVGPTLLQEGVAVPLREMMFAGTATPASALQSVLALQREGDLPGYFDLMLALPDEEDQLLLATDEGRARGAEILKAQVQSLDRLEILTQRTISENRTQLIFREFHSGKEELETNSLTFGRTSQGWKQIP